MLSMVGIAANAQRNIVLTASITKPALDTNITTTSTQNPIFYLKNVSASVADSLMPGDTVRIASPLSTIVGSSITTSSFTMVGSLRKGDSMSVTVTGGIPFANINTLMTLTGDTVVPKTFTNNKQYNWYFVFASAKAPSTNIAMAATTPSAVAKRRIWINKTPTGIDEISFEGPSIKTFPNPAANQLSFEYNFETSEKATATIMDAAGRTVLVREFDNNNSGNQRLDLDITSISNGMYFLKVNVGEKSSTTKFNVQK